MANLEVKNPPEFIDEIYKTEREDLLTAELENSIKGDLLNNDVFLKQKLQEETSRAQAAEETNKNNLANHVVDKANPHKVTKAQVGLGNVDNTADVNKPVSTAQQNALDASYRQATGYTDRKIADLIGGAPETLDTLKEVADAIQANKDVSEALDAAIRKKANQTELDTHTGNNTIHITSQERTNWNDANTKKHTHNNKSVLDKITQALLDSWNAAYSHISDAIKHITSAERTNWNAAKTHADSAHARTDATKTEKSNTNGNVKINGTETTVYTHPNTSGNKHIPSGGSSGQILRWSADGTAVWGSDNNTTYSTATQSANGLLSAADKKKLDGISEGANKIIVDSALSSTSANPIQNKIVKSALDGKAASSHTHNYAGSSSAGGSANSAVKLDSSAGTTVQPVYFKDGKPTACTYSLNASVPSGAKFTDTTYSSMSAATASAAGKAGLVPAPAAGKQGAFLRGDGTWAKPSLRKIKVVQGDKIRITTNTYCFLSDFQSVYTLKTTELIIFNMVAAASYGSSDIVWKLSGLRGTSTTNWTGIAFSKIFDSLSWNFVSIFSISRMELMNGPNMCIEMTLGSAPIQACEIFYSDNVEIIKI